MNTYIYFHICCVNNWKEVVKYLLFNIKVSGLYDKIDEIRCVILGEYDNSLFDPKIKIIYKDLNIGLYEKKIMNLIYEDSLKDNFNILYIHSKGVTKPYNIHIKKWVEYMTYFVISKHEICLEKLIENDTVGVNYQDEPKRHYSGNFWWSKSSHIKLLGDMVDESYNGPEFYICSKDNGTYCSLWSTGVLDLYYNSYDAENYINQI